MKIGFSAKNGLKIREKNRIPWQDSPRDWFQRNQRWFQVELDTLYRFHILQVRCRASMTSESGFYLELSGYL